MIGAPSSKRKANGQDPAVIVLVKLRNRELHAAAHENLQPPDDRKRTYDEARRQKYLFSSVQRTAGPKCSVLLEDRPQFAFDPIVNSGVENDRSAE